MKINLQIDFEVKDNMLPDDCLPMVIAKAQHQLHYCEEGRYPFDIETLQLALHKIIENSVRGTIYDQYKAKYGNETMQYPGTAIVDSKAYIEFHKLNINVWINDSELNFTI